MSLDDKNENTEWRKSVFGWKLENKYEIERQNGMTSMNEKKNDPNENFYMIY